MEIYDAIHGTINIDKSTCKIIIQLTNVCKILNN